MIEYTTFDSPIGEIYIAAVKEGVVKISFSNESPEELENYLHTNDIQLQRGIEDQIIMMNGGEFRLVTIHGIEDFGAFRQNVFLPKLINIFGK